MRHGGKRRQEQKGKKMEKRVKERTKAHCRGLASDYEGLGEERANSHGGQAASDSHRSLGLKRHVLVHQVWVGA